MTLLDLTLTPYNVEIASDFPRRFVLETRPYGHVVATVDSFRPIFERAALPLLQEPRVRYRAGLMKPLRVEVESKNGHFLLEIGCRHFSLTAEIEGDPVPAIRFCENLQAFFYGPVRIRTILEEKGPFVLPPSGYLFGKVTATRETSFQRLSLVEHPVYGQVLLTDQEIQIGQKDQDIYNETFVAHALPDDARRVLILGGGDCGLLRHVLKRDVQRVVMVELDSEVVEFCTEHLPDLVGDAPRDARAEIVHDDAFVYLKTTDEKFDVVLADLADQPISGLNLDDQVGLMCRVLAPGGVLASHAERLQIQDSTYRTEPMVAAFARRFEGVDVVCRRIPTFQDQLWLFLRSRGAPRFAASFARPGAAEPGSHWLLDCYQCSSSLLQDIPALERSVRDCLKSAELSVSSGKFSLTKDGQTTGVFLLETGHLGVHLKPKQRFAALDLYLQDQRDASGVLTRLALDMGAKDPRPALVRRGLPEESPFQVEEYRRVPSVTVRARSEDLPSTVRVERSEGRGFGLFATRDLTEGEVVYTTRVRLYAWSTEFIVQTDLGESVHSADTLGWELQPALVETWPDAIRRQVVTHFGLEKDDTVTLVITLTKERKRDVLISGIDGLHNHSDEANVAKDWLSAELRFDDLHRAEWTVPVRALRAVRAGEELFNNYTADMPDLIPENDWTH